MNPWSISTLHENWKAEPSLCYRSITVGGRPPSTLLPTLSADTREMTKKTQVCLSVTDTQTSHSIVRLAWYIPLCICFLACRVLCEESSSFLHNSPRVTHQPLSTRRTGRALHLQVYNRPQPWIIAPDSRLHLLPDSACPTNSLPAPSGPSRMFLRAPNITVPPVEHQNMLHTMILRSQV